MIENRVRHSKASAVQMPCFVNLHDTDLVNVSQKTGCVGASPFETRPLKGESAPRPLITPNIRQPRQPSVHRYIDYGAHVNFPVINSMPLANFGGEVFA